MTDALPEFGTPREHEERRDGGCAVVFDPKTRRFAVGEETEGGRLRLFSGGIDPEEDSETGTLREVTEESGLHDFARSELLGEAFAHYYNRLRDVNRVAKVHGFLVLLRSTETVPVQLEEHERFVLAWKTADEILANWQAHNQDHGLDHWVHFLTRALARIEELGYALR